MRLCMLSLPHALSLYRSSKAFGYALGVDAALEAIGHEKIRMCGGYGERGNSLRCLFLVC